MFGRSKEDFACDALAIFIFRFASCLLTQRLLHTWYFTLLKILARQHAIPGNSSFMLVPFFASYRSFLARPACLGAVLGWVIYAISPSYRRRMRENMQGAGFRNTARGRGGASVLELPFIWCAPAERVARHATVENWELVQQACSTAAASSFTPHLGCFEIVAQQIALRTAHRDVPPAQARRLKAADRRRRARENLMLAPANMSGVRIFAKCLKKASPSACCRTRCRRKAKACGPISSAVPPTP
jgi:hypothetical protein